MKERQINFQKRKIIGTAVAIPVIILMGMGLLLIADGSWFFLGMGSLLIAMGILSSKFVIEILFFKKPALIIDREGIIDTSSALGAGRVAWHEMLNITGTNLLFYKTINIILHEPEQFIRKEKSLLKRLLMHLNYKTGKTPVLLNVPLMEMNFEDLLQVLQEEHKKAPLVDFVSHLIEE